ncbi:MAG: DUF6141 family protein [Pseudomonadota bacterium]
MTFKEIQRFTQRWLWIMLILSMLVLVGVFGYGVIQQLVFGNPWGDRPVSDLTLILVSSAVILFGGGMIYLFYSLRLITEVRPEGLYVRFYPLRSKIIPFHRIKSCQARSYKPLSEYGGWGIKYGPSGWAYNVQGNRGVQLILDNGKRILIGSQRAVELERATKHHCAC